MKIQTGGITMTDYQKYEQIKQQIDTMGLNYQQREEILKIIADILKI